MAPSGLTSSFLRYTTGFNLVESFYLAMPFVSWQAVVVGDPLCAPFRTKALAAGDIDSGIDRSTEVPQFLSDRRVGALTSLGMKPEAAKLMVKSEVRVANGDEAGAREALEQATALDNAFVPAQMALASLYRIGCRMGQGTRSISANRRENAGPASGIEQPGVGARHARDDPGQALSFAKRAYTVDKAIPEAGDTLAWVQHLLGNDADAEPLISAALRALPGLAEVHLHAAAIFAATGNAQAATRELDMAIRLDATLGDRADVKALRARLGSSQ